MRSPLKASVSVLTILGLLLVPASAFGAGSANTATCPLATETSPGFRIYLPDCRAYELVSPSFTGGFPPAFPVTPGSGPQSNQYDPASFLFASFGTFAETPNGSESPTIQTALYNARRTPGGWQTSSTMPPINSFEIMLPTGTTGTTTVVPSSDHAAFAWVLREKTEGARTSLYLREGAGPFELVGPVTPFPESPLKGTEAPVIAELAAADLSRVPLFAKVPSTGIDPWLWPGDTSLKNADTLYEYDRSEPGIGTPSAEPKLVGVKNNGRLASNSEAQLISQCGTVLGGGFIPARLENAVSQDGKYIFFTAQKKAIGAANTQCPGPTPVQPVSSEVYARVDGEETVAISNPSAADCAACLTGVARTAAETAVANLQAVYQGASVDGTKVFFTSFQELFAGIKASGTTSNLYRYDFEAPAGQKLELVSKVPSGSAEVSAPPANFTGISADGERAYFVAKKVLAENESQAYDPLTDGFQKAEVGKFNFYVWEAPKEGGEASIKFIAQLPSGSLNPVTTPDGRFAVFGTTAQLVESNESTVAQLFMHDAESGALVRVSVGDQGFNDNGNTSVNAPGLGTAEPILVSADGHRVFFVSSNALTPGALTDPSNEFKNIYQWTWTGSEPSEADARVFLILSAPGINSTAGSRTVRLRGIDPLGQNVYFTTTGKLVPQHAGGQQAIYTARAEGGFPGLPDEIGCEADACQGLPSTAPGANTLASALLSGPGNATNQRKRTSRRCPSGKRRVRKAGGGTRCAPKQNKRNRRQTKTNRRAGR